MQQASDCDIVLVHDNDLVMVDGLGLDTVSRLLNSSYIVPSCYYDVSSHCQWKPSKRM